MHFLTWRRTMSLLVTVCFCLTGLNLPSVSAQELVLPQAGLRMDLSPGFTPAHLSGMTIHPEHALKFDFLISKGNTHLSDSQKQDEYASLIKYFLASLTIPDEDQWVNLSPYEKGRIIKDNFGKTEMGRNLLAQDYLLKQISSSLTYPETGLGKKFWDEIYKRTQEKYGNTNIPVNTFNKVWIVPDEAIVYESGNTAYILKSHLKVMMEEDYLSLTKNSKDNAKSISTLSSEVMREIVLPSIEKEVNEGKNFAMLRQIYSGMILATWYKKALKESLLGKVYADKAKVKGVDINPQANEEVYRRYLAAFKKGAYNFIKDDEDKYTHQIIPRRYFSGGFTRGMNDTAMRIVDKASISLDQAVLAQEVFSSSIDRAETVLENTADKQEPLFVQVDAQYKAVDDLYRWEALMRKKIRTEGILDMYGNKMMADDGYHDGLWSMILYASMKRKKIVSEEFITLLIRVSMALKDQTMSYDDTTRILNAKNFDEASQILIAMVPQRKNLNVQPITDDFRKLAGQIFSTLQEKDKMTVQNDITRGSIEVFDLGLPLVQDMIKTSNLLVIKPDSNILTMLTDKELLDKSRSWAENELPFRIGVDQKGNIYFLKMKDFQLIARYLFRLDYIPANELDETKSFYNAIRNDLQKAIDGLRAYHPDPRPSNLLVRVLRTPDGLKKDFEPIDFDRDDARTFKDQAVLASQQPQLLPEQVNTRGYSDFTALQGIKDKDRRTKTASLLQSIRDDLKGVDLPNKDVLVSFMKNVSEDSLRKMIILGSYLRKSFEHEINQNDVKPYLRYGIEEEIYFSIGPNLYISPTTGSFRRNFIFKTDDQGRVLFAVEFMIPGEHVAKHDIDGKLRQEVASKINSESEGRDPSVNVLLTRTIPFTENLYDQKLRGQKATIVIFDYSADGQRLSHLTPRMMEVWAKEMGITVQALNDRIVYQSLVAFLSFKKLGYFAGTDGHAENFRVELKYENNRLSGIGVKLVADFDGVETLGKIRMFTLVAGAAGIVGALYSYNYYNIDPSVSEAFWSMFFGLGIGIGLFFDYWVFLGGIGSLSEGLLFKSQGGFSHFAQLYQKAIKEVYGETSRVLFYESVKAAVGSMVGITVGSPAVYLMPSMDEVFKPVLELANPVSRYKAFAWLFRGKGGKGGNVALTSDDASLTPVGGIDLNSVNMKLQIKRDGRGIPLPINQQDLAQLSQVQGFEPRILEIKPALALPILSELKQKFQTQASVS